MEIDDKTNAFSKDRYIAKEVLKLKKEFNLECAIETGSAFGETTDWLGYNFDYVFSVENNPKNHNSCKERFKDRTNINLHLGDSVSFVQEMVNINKNKKCLFYLDAHGSIPTPTPLELKHIINMKEKPCIVIHDFFVPNKNFNYDKYGDFEYKIENIIDTLDLIYNKNYEFYYNDRTDPEGYNVGCIFIKPKKLV